jgi:hypothetical protein
MLKSMKSGGTKLMGKAALGVAGKKALTKKGGGAIMKSTGKKVYGAAAKAAVTKGTAKIAGKTLAKSALKKIPGVGLIAGLGFGLSRLMKGDLAGAVGEIASGAASIIPGLGTAASLAIDAGLAARDISKANKDSAEVIGEQSTAIEQKVSAEEPDTMKKMAEHQVTDSETTKVYQEKSLIMLQQIIEANNQTGTKVEGLTKE